MPESPRKLLVTSALPYANGEIHLGHLVEYIQTDIWVRFQRLVGNHCVYVCASDAHGTPIMIKAEQEGVSPEALIDAVSERHQRDFAEFMIRFDNFHSTHSVENREIVSRIYEALKAGGHIERRTITQAYDEQRGMFLPDRFVRGTCPSCGAADQYGDSCEVCGATYAPTDLKDPVSILSGTRPAARDSEHLFFRLSDFAELLEEWLGGDRIHPSLAAKLREWFRSGLQDWDISRDAPYFGFPIPGETDKYFYVWLDAPVGYMASFRHLCEREPELDFDAWWRPGSDTELHHFIGKDIAYFHALFWPAVLAGSGYRTPTAVHVHGFLTINGQKMSKSRGTFITARRYLDHLHPEYLRYYYAAKLGPGVDDIDLSLDDFVARVNADLVGKVVNIASRCAGFIHRVADGRLSDELESPDLQAEFIAAADTIAAAYEAREFSRAMRTVMTLADRANQYIDTHKPWVMAKTPGNEAAVAAVCSQGLNLFRLIVLYLKPVLPRLAADAEHFLGVTPMHWETRHAPLLGHEIAKFKPLLQRVTAEQVAGLVEAESSAN